MTCDMRYHTRPTITQSKAQRHTCAPSKRHRTDDDIRTRERPPRQSISRAPNWTSDEKHSAAWDQYAPSEVTQMHWDICARTHIARAKNTHAQAHARTQQQNTPRDKHQRPCFCPGAKRSPNTHFLCMRTNGPGHSKGGKRPSKPAVGNREQERKTKRQRRHKGRPTTPRSQRAAGKGTPHRRTPTTQRPPADKRKQRARARKTQRKRAAARKRPTRATERKEGHGSDATPECARAAGAHPWPRWRAQQPYQRPRP